MIQWPVNAAIRRNKCLPGADSRLRESMLNAVWSRLGAYCIVDYCSLPQQHLEYRLLASNKQQASVPIQGIFHRQPDTTFTRYTRRVEIRQFHLSPFRPELSYWQRCRILAEIWSRNPTRILRGRRQTLKAQMANFWCQPKHWYLVYNWLHFSSKRQTTG